MSRSMAANPLSIVMCMCSNKCRVVRFPAKPGRWRAPLGPFYFRTVNMHHNPGGNDASFFSFDFFLSSAFLSHLGEEKLAG